MEKDELESKNVLNIGIATIAEIEKRLKDFETINLKAKKKRFISSRQTILDNRNKQILEKGENINFTKLLLLKKNYPHDHKIKIFQPDDGLILLSNINDSNGIHLSMNLIQQVVNMDMGAYKSFIDRVDSFYDLKCLLKKGAFPKMVIIGYISPNEIKNEIFNYEEIIHEYPYLRFIELLHVSIKPNPIIPKAKTVLIESEENSSWNNFIDEVIKEYNKPYLLKNDD